MKEFSLNLRESLRLGLRPTRESEVGLAECYLLKPGLEEIDAPTYPVTGVSQTVAWPLPMLVRGSQDTLLLNYTSGSGLYSLYEVNESTWAAGSDKTTSGQLKSADDFSTMTTIPHSGGIWHWAERNGSWLLTNGDGFLTNATLYGEWVVGDDGDALVPNSLCILQDRMICGGVAGSSTYIAAAHWTAIWNAWKTYAPPGVFSDSSMAVDDSYLLWGMAGGGDSAAPFTPILCALTGYKSSTLGRLVVDAFRTGQMGLAKIPWRGVIRAVRTLGNRVMIYGSEGIGMLVPLDNPPFYTIIYIANIGVPNRGAVGGAPHVHYFIDNDGFLWKIQNEYIPQKLGYEEFFSIMLAQEIATTFDPLRGDTYISGTSKCYLVNAEGVTEARYRPTSLFDASGTLYGTFDASATATFTVVGPEMEMARRAIKLLKVVEIDQRNLSSIQVAVDYKHKESDSYTRSTAINVNDEDAAFPMMSGTDLRVVVTGSVASNAALRNITARWSILDGRTVRGLTEQTD